MIAASRNLEVCIDDIVIKKEIVKEEKETPVVKEIKEDKFSSEKTELFKNIKSSDALGWLLFIYTCKVSYDGAWKWFTGDQ